MTSRILSTKAITQVYYRLLFNQCYVCEYSGEGLLCQHCQSFLSLNRHCCHRCARPTPIDIEECGECQRTPPAFDRVIAPLQYEGLCRAMISKAKFEHQPHLLRPLISYLAEDVLLPPLASSDWAIVPTSHTSLKQRGFCQTQFIRRQLRSALRLNDCTDVQHVNLQRTYQGQAQHHLNRQERRKLSSKHFQLMEHAPKHVILIDDIITTGSTIQACSLALKRAGTEQVTVWALARTPEHTGDLT